MAALAERAGLKLVYTHYIDIHGVSSLYVLSHDYDDPDILSIELAAISSGLTYMTAQDRSYARLRRYRTSKDWEDFHLIAAVRSAGALAVVESWKDQNHRVVAVGAAAKAITFLRAAGIESNDAEVEKFVNQYKSTIDIVNDAFNKFDIVKSFDILHWYNYENYTYGSEIGRAHV